MSRAGAAGEAHSAALTSNGFLFMWGSNDKGQLGLPAAADVAAQNSVSPLMALMAWLQPGSLVDCAILIDLHL